MSKRYFGTDGIRGTVGDHPITADFVLKLGWAAGRVLAGGQSGSTVLIGKDTRISGYMFESVLEAPVGTSKPSSSAAARAVCTIGADKGCSPAGRTPMLTISASISPPRSPTSSHRAHLLLREILPTTATLIASPKSVSQTLQYTSVCFNL